MATPFKRPRRGSNSRRGPYALQKAYSEEQYLVQTTPANLFEFKPSEIINLLMTDRFFYRRALAGYYIYLDGAVVIKNRQCVSVRDERMFICNGINARCCVVKKVLIRKVYERAKLKLEAAARPGGPPTLSFDDKEEHRNESACVETSTTMVSIQPPSLITRVTPDNLCSFIRKPNDTFCVLFKNHMARVNLTVEQLAERAGVSSKTIQRMRNEAGYRPALRSLVAVCLSMNLPPYDSAQLLHLTGYVLNSSEEEQLYELLLSMCWMASMEEINNFLDSINFPNFRS